LFIVSGCRYWKVMLLAPDVTTAIDKRATYFYG